jgi:hypothetical protein
MSAQAPPKQEPLKDKDLDKIEFKLTDLELQFISDEIIRRDQMLQEIMKKYAMSIQHFVAVCALKKNLQSNPIRRKPYCYCAKRVCRSLPSTWPAPLP